MIVGVPTESYPGERRVALVPAAVQPLAKIGAEVIVQSGAGRAAGYPDAAYADKGATMVETRSEVFERADVVAQVRAYGANPQAGADDVGLLREGHVVVGFCEPLSEPQLASTFAESGAGLLSMELMPRITRAQSMDALSSMATVAGYKAVLLAADALPRMFPMLMTAAGTISPARVFVVGAGVAGLQAIATAKRLGAVVSAYDIRPAVKEQVESVGGKFVELELETGESEDAGGYAKELDEEFYRKQREMMTAVVAESDVVITTAAVPGKKAPILVTEAMVDGMRPGSVVVDLAAERGGNCELTQAGKTVDHDGVSVLGPENLPTEVPFHASQMYSKNVVNFLSHLIEDGKLDLDTEDEIAAGTLVARDGEVVHPSVRELLEGKGES